MQTEMTSTNNSQMMQTNTQQTNNDLLFSPSLFNDKIKYLHYFSESRNKMHEIERSKITAKTIARGFNEYFNEADKYIRLYFDIDHLETLEQYNDFIGKFMEPLAQKLDATYSFGGYSNNEEIASATGLRHQPNADKVISLHFTFPNIAISINDLNNLISNYEINEFIDCKVYKTSEQLMRHVLSDKRTTQREKEDKAGNIVKGDMFSMLLTPTGEEHLLTIEEIDKLFTKKPQTKITPKTDDKITFDDIENFKQENNNENNNNKHLINLTIDAVIELLCDNVDPDYNNTCHILSLLVHSPFTIEQVEEIAEAWYSKRSHKTAFDVVDYIHKYYEFEDSDKWIYSILKMFDETKQQELQAKYKIYKSININNGTITMDKVVRRKYKNMKTLIYDLKSCVGIVDNKLYIKKNYRQRNGTYKMKLTELTHEEFNNTYNLVHPFRNMKMKDLDEDKQDEQTLNKFHKMTLKDVINSQSDKFIYNNIKKSKDNISDVINEFAGLPYKPIQGDNLIQPFLKHILQVVCEDDNEKFDYVMKWFANIVQNIYVKNGTMLIFYGSKGCGKSIFTDIMAELLGDLATPSVCDMGKIFGKFNDFLTKKIYININEAPDYDKKKSMTQTIKETITSTYLAVEGKGKSVRDGEQFANFTITTNFDDPVEVEIGDRRLAFFHCSNRYVGNSEYFNNLMINIKDRYNNNYNAEFMGQLYNYMLNIDLTNFNAAEYVIKLNNDYNNVNNENLERQYYNSNDLIRYLCDNVEQFIRGITIDEIIRTLTNYSKNGLGKKLKNYCDFKQLTQKDYNKIYNIECDYELSNSKQYYYFFKEHPDDIESLIKWRANTQDIIYDYNMIKANYKLIEEYFKNEAAEKEEIKQQKQQAKKDEQQKKEEIKQQKQQAKKDEQQKKEEDIMALEQEIRNKLSHYEYRELEGYNLRGQSAISKLLNEICEIRQTKKKGKKLTLYKLKESEPTSDDDIFEDI